VPVLELHGVTLISPAAGVPVKSGAPAVVFVWRRGEERLPPGYGYELVFWNPAQEDAKRGPSDNIDSLAAPQEMQAVANLGDMSDGSKFSDIVMPGQDVCWGVRAWDRTNKVASILLSGEVCRRIRYELDAAEEKPENESPGPSTPGMTPEGIDRSTPPAAVGPGQAHIGNQPAHEQDAQGE
jgi:hypothetical protein